MRKELPDITISRKLSDLPEKGEAYYLNSQEELVRFIDGNLDQLDYTKTNDDETITML